MLVCILEGEGVIQRLEHWGGRRHKTQYREMTRDCGHSTGDDQRLRTVQEMTRDCGQYRDDQRLQT
ncbi:unnamed protein product, partial [Staurois parvus]